MVIPIVGFHIISTSYFQSVGKAKQSIFLSMSRQILFLVPLVIFMPQFIGLDGIWLANPVADVLSAMLSGSMFWLAVRKMNRQIECQS
jgi:Na+-driven multidrug efflux pump